VKVASPIIDIVAMGQGFTDPETGIFQLYIGESWKTCWGIYTIAGERTVCIGTWENLNFPRKSQKEPKR
jgi:hypothetical protein